MRPTIAMDFDGVIHSYTSPWTKPHEIPGPPVPGALDFMHRALNRGFNVVIHSSRCRTWRGRRAIRSWLYKHAGMMWYESMDVTGLEDVGISKHKPPAIVTIDDRALTFDGTFPSLEVVKNFRPWNKREEAVVDISSDPSSWITVLHEGKIGSFIDPPPKGSEVLTGSVVDHVDPIQLAAAALALRKELPQQTIIVLRERIRTSPKDWPVIDGWHFSGGMHLRNKLRDLGFGEEPLKVCNLDDVYVHIVETALRMEDPVTEP